MLVNRLYCVDNDARRRAAELIGRDTYQNSPSHNSEALQVSEYAENTPWSAQNPQARHGDPRLGPDAGPLYGKSAAQYGQSLVNARTRDTALTQPVTWTVGNETSAAPSNTAQPPAVTPGLFTVVIVASYS